ncbi:unnamed protein product, partial [Mesorhabditis belari]|uniref:Ig-like domain-containing protein n=1 Tax=Mesorhabditis belari TaxID=2138241 RepID=A0AAF3FRC3_9BILA
MPPDGDVHLVQSAVPSDGIPPGSTDTTTISTIAVKAGNHATIVVALLRSMGYVELRIDEMHPGLLAIGAGVEETRNLLAIHDDVMNRLREKEDQVEVLLSRADNLAHEKEDPNEQIVYEAMARSLNAAWRELLKQLQLRGYLLQDCYKFYSLASKHQQLISFLSQGGNGDVFNDLLDITAEAIDLGASIIAQIRTLGLINDNEHRPKEVLLACEVIEKIMLKMALDWERVEATKEHLQTQHIQQQQKAQHESQLEENAFTQIEDWVSRAERRVVAANDFGLSVLLNEAAEQQHRLDSLNQIDSKRVETLHHRISELVERIHKKLNAAQRIHQFYGAANSMSAQLEMMEQDMRNANAAMAGELAPLARQKASVVIGEGRNILTSEKLTYEEQRTIQMRVNELETKLKRLEELAEQRIHETQFKSSQLVSTLSQWLQQSGERFMTESGDMGSTQHDGSRFIDSHRDFAQEIINQESSVQTMYQQASQLNETDRRTVQEFEKRYDTLKRQLEERIHLGQTFEQVHKFSQDLHSSFAAINSLLDSTQGGINENVATQMNNVFHMIQETLGQERQQGERFISRAQQASTTDRSLKIDKAIESVRNVLMEHEQKFTEITQKWTTWEQQKTSNKKLQNVIEEIQIWQEEVIEIIGLLENTHIVSTKESEGLKRRVREIEDTITQQTTRLEEAKQSTKDEQLLRRIDSAQQRQHYIHEKVAALERKVNTIHETFLEEEIREVIKAPEILAPLKEAVVNEGSRFEFAARIEAEPEPAICWLKDGVDVKQNVDYHTEFVNGVATLTIEETFVEDSALYTIRAANKGGTVESSARLNVISRSQADHSLAEGKPHFVRQLQNLSVTEGEEIHLECVIVGKPEPEVVWVKEDTNIREDNRIRFDFLGDRCSLIISNSQQNDSGLYTVKAKNSLGEASNFARLQVSPRAKVGFFVVLKFI